MKPKEIEIKIDKKKCFHTTNPKKTYYLKKVPCCVKFTLLICFFLFTGKSISNLFVKPPEMRGKNIIFLSCDFVFRKYTMAHTVKN